MTTIFWVTITLSLVAVLLSAWVLYRLSRMDLELRGMEIRVDHMLAELRATDHMLNELQAKPDYRDPVLGVDLRTFDWRAPAKRHRKGGA